MILIVDKSPKHATLISDIFRYMGILSATTSPEKAMSDISNRHRAILISSPEKINAADELIRNLRTYSLGAPIFALSRTASCEGFDKKLFDKIFDYDSYSASVVISILDYQKEHKLKYLGNYTLAGIDASIFIKGVTYFDDPFPLTKTETMILRYLISTYPSRAKAAEILKYAFRSENKPEITNIRTHIYSINRKFKELTGRALILSEAREGYRIRCVLFENIDEMRKSRHKK